ncbi:MAG: PTS fructose transporter subunit IIA [Pseudomonadota bacterium]|nr:PTS fructose transporter subunit IIA [Pseudomonadota bacterium]
MSVAILIVSHHNIGKAIVEAVEISFAHNLPLRLATIDVGANDDPDVIKPRVRQMVEKLDDGSGVLILSDLFGSTPCNICSECLANPNVRILTGLNLPMLLRTMNYPQQNLVELTETARIGGQNGIRECSAENKES